VFVCLWWQTGQGRGRVGWPGQTPAHWRSATTVWVVFLQCKRFLLVFFLPLTSFLPLSLTRSFVLSPPTVVIAYKTQRIRRVPSVSLSICPSVEVLKPISLLIKLSPRIRGPKNYSRPRVLTSYFYFYVRFCATIVVVDGGDIFGLRV
jgi:hypothetical protein